jgi:hypothetical protein
MREAREEDAHLDVWEVRSGRGSLGQSYHPKRALSALQGALEAVRRRGGL